MYATLGGAMRSPRVTRFVNCSRFLLGVLRFFALLLLLLPAFASTPNAHAASLSDRQASLLRTDWFWSSVPSGKVADLATHAGIQWYNPANAVKEHDLRPVLSQAEGGENVHQVLEMNFLSPGADSTNTMFSEDWNGVTQSLGTVGQDFTKLQNIEIWVNDFHNSSYAPNPQQHSDTHAVLHMDFGRVDEDAFWDSKHVPNGLLDTEDKNGNGVLDRPLDAQGKPLNPGQVGGYEDTGLDGRIDADEPGYNAYSNKDPDGDDYAYNPNTSPNDYSKINNTEGNGIDAESRPDTEDLNRNGVLDRENAYFEATVDFSQDQYVAIDVPQLYGNLDVVRNNPNNGWRLFRIPVSDSTFTRIGAGSWDNVQAMRFWMDGMNTPQKFQIGGVRFVGVPAPLIARPLVLHQNRPNPFNPGTVIEYELRQVEPVRLEIFDVAGRKIATLVDGQQGPGPHSAVWSGRTDRGDPVPSGVYFYRLGIPGHDETRRMVLLK
jgi:flagellar hook capping protein FlgD